MLVKVKCKLFTSLSNKLWNIVNIAANWETVFFRHYDICIDDAIFKNGGCETGKIPFMVYLISLSNEKYIHIPCVLF